jgi:hypothetical protein
MNLLHFPPEEGMPLTEVFQKGLIVHVARGFMPHDDLTNPADQVNRSLVWSGHLLPKARLFEHFGDGLPKPRRPDVKNRSPITLAEAHGANV